MHVITFYTHSCALSIVLFVFHCSTPREVGATPNDDDFVNLYGNDANTSGIWQRARDIASSDPEKLKTISFDAHMSVWPYHRDTARIRTAQLTTGTLMFPKTKYQDICIDLIEYQLVDPPQYTFYLTKGLKPDCVFYCGKLDNVTAGSKWGLRNPVCDLSI